MWVDYGRREAVADGPHGAVWICVDAEGRAIGNPCMESYGDDATGEVIKNIMAWYNPSLLAISFLHCKNVTMVHHAVDKPLAKKWAARHGGMRPTAYKTGDRAAQGRASQRGPRARARAGEGASHLPGAFLRLRRGAAYLGNIGKFWIPSTVRGTKGKAAPREIEVKV